MYDNAPAYSAGTTTAALDSIRIPLLKWPARSPDLNLTENV